MNYWTSKELAALRRLRERFLTAEAGAGDYWQQEDDLLLYDQTFAERIGWKCDAVLQELTIRGWKPQSSRIFDFGCGSGVANRRVLAHWPEQFVSLTLHDRSANAMQFASNRARDLKSSLTEVQVAREVETLPEDTLFVASHVLNELAPENLQRLLSLIRQAREVIWIEAGTHADSRRLGAEVRAALLLDFSVIAPCTHQAACGMFAPENHAHWCHTFAKPPSWIFQDGRWSEFGREMGIDLRSVPYSFLVLERRSGVEKEQGLSRMIGEPRDYKGFSKILSCQEDGVAELTMQKRDDPALLKEIRAAKAGAVFRWTVDRNKITKGEAIARPPARIVEESDEDEE